MKHDLTKALRSYVLMAPPGRYRRTTWEETIVYADRAVHAIIKGMHSLSSSSKVLWAYPSEVLEIVSPLLTAGPRPQPLACRNWMRLPSQYGEIWDKHVLYQDVLCEAVLGLVDHVLSGWGYLLWPGQAVGVEGPNSSGLIRAEDIRRLTLYMKTLLCHHDYGTKQKPLHIFWIADITCGRRIEGIDGKVPITQDEMDDFRETWKLVKQSQRFCRPLVPGATTELDIQTY